MVAAPPNSTLDERVILIDLPTVDLAAERSTTAKLIVKACEEYGFFNIINHGVPQDLVAKMEEAGFDFFAKPLPQKEAVRVFGDYPFGYGSRNIGFNGDKGEVEYLILNASSSSSSSAPYSVAQLSQKISNDPSNFSSIVSAYTDAVRELACEILELMAEGLGVPDPLVFSRLIRAVDSDSVLRFNHYPPILNKDPCKERDKSASEVGFGAHSDPQILTILRSNDVGGLQISLQDGVWNPVTPHPSAFCVNVGDLLQVMTNGRFLSVRHRAVTNSHKCRMSVAYFGTPPLDACIVAPPVMVTPERPSLLFRAFTWAEYKKVTYALRLGDSRIHFFRNWITQVE